MEVRRTQSCDVYRGAEAGRYPLEFDHVLLQRQSVQRSGETEEGSQKTRSKTHLQHKNRCS